MKIQSIPSILAALALPLAITSCGDKKEEAAAPGEGANPAAAPAYSSHSAVIAEVETLMNDMMTSMTSIKDVPSAEAFAAKIKDIQPKMKELLAAAKSLGEPSEEDKTAYMTAQRSAEEKAGPAMMAMMMGMQNNPDAEKIGEILEGAFENDEMNEVGDAIDAIYSTGEEGEMEEATIELPAE